MRKALFRFFQLSCASFVTNFGLTLGLHEWGQMPEAAAFAMALAAVLVLNFVVMRWYIYETPTGALKFFYYRLLFERRGRLPAVSQIFLGRPFEV